MTTAPPKETKKNGCLSGCGTLFLGFLGISVFGFIVASFNKTELTPEQKALEAKEQQENWYNNLSPISCERELKKDLRDPSSYKRIGDFITTSNKSNTKIVSWKFRATNGFGGYTTGAGVCTINKDNGGTFDVRVVNQ